MSESYSQSQNQVHNGNGYTNNNDNANYTGTSSNSDVTNLYLVGHSLGGGIAQIVAANLYEDYFNSYVASIGSNSPGTLYSSSKFGFSTEALQKTSTSILAERDFISKIDEHGGNIQKIECDSNQIFDCHLTELPICELYNNCADSSKNFQFGNCLNATKI